MKSFTNSDAKKAFVSAVKQIESVSSAEVVVAVRPMAERYMHAHLWVGVIIQTACLGFMLFSPWFYFSTRAIFIEPIAVAAVIAALTLWLPVVKRWFTRPSSRRRACLREAESTFFRDGIRHTKQKIGVLVAFFVLEREAVILADEGLLFPDGALEEVTRKLNLALVQTQDGAACAKVMERELGPLLAAIHPITDDDENELPDEVSV